MEKTLSQRRVQELKYPSSAYANQERIKSQVVEMMGKKSQGSGDVSLEQKFNFLHQGAERVAFLRTHETLLEQMLSKPELRHAEAFIRAICVSPLVCKQGQFRFKGEASELYQLATELNQVFSHLVINNELNHHQHLAIELDGALTALHDDMADEIAKKAILDILAVMVAKILK